MIEVRWLNKTRIFPASIEILDGDDIYLWFPIDPFRNGEIAALEGWMPLPLGWIAV